MRAEQPRVGLGDQNVGAGASQPGEDAPLPADVGIHPPDIEVAPADTTGRPQAVGYRDSLFRTWLAGKHLQTPCALSRQAIKERHAVGGQNPLLDANTPGEPSHQSTRVIHPLRGARRRADRLKSDTVRTSGT